MGFLRTLHRWVGLVLFLAIAAVAASGGLLLLRDPYYRARHPEVRAAPTADARTYAPRLEAIERAFGREGIRVIRFPRDGMNAFHVWLADGSQALVDPASGRVLERWQWYDSLPGFLFELHAHLLAGRTGSVVNGIAALWVMFLGLTGLLLWLRRRRAFPLSGAVARRWTPGDLLRSHAATGFLLFVPVTLFAATGAALIFYEPLWRAASAVLDASPPREPDATVTRRDALPRPWREIIAAVEGTFPSGRTAMYYPGAGDNAVLTFRKQLPGEWHPNGRSYVLVDPYSARVVQAIDARQQGRGTRLMHAIYPVHAAKTGGWTLIALAALAAVGLTWLAIGGATSYVMRWRLGRRAAERAAPIARQFPAAMLGSPAEARVHVPHDRGADGSVRAAARAGARAAAAAQYPLDHERG